MNDFAKSWVAALRSGKYRQGRSYLRCNKEFCVMGVACDLMRSKLIVSRVFGGIFKYDYSDSVLPIRVQKALGLKTRVGFLTNHLGRCTDLIELNDTGLTFTEIADLIEQHQGELFHVSPVAGSVTDIQADSNLS